MLYIGVDPGRSGAIAVVGPMWQFEACRLSLPHRDVFLWLQHIVGNEETTACLEAVHAMPRDGRSSAFKFGTSYGACRMLLAAVVTTWTEVDPRVWQKNMNCLTGGDKRVSRDRARQMFPHLPIYVWNADAFLIAEYARRKAES